MSVASLDSQYENADSSPGFLLWQVSNKWQAKQRAALRPFELTHVQFVLLATLTYAAGKNSFTQKQLAEYAQVDVMMTSQVVRKLEQKGLVSRLVSSSDSRAIAINITDSGVKLANQALKAVERVDKEFFKVAGTDLAILIGMMQILAKNDSQRA